MKIAVEFYSVLQDVAGRQRLDHETADEGVYRVADLLEALYARFPGLGYWDSRLHVAVDLEFTSRDACLRDGQEVAIMPPFQGG
ncbi:MAG TPA: MoaD/ThiS family protein [Verrucomicrobiales bacterium]|nr:MoaD/ThiS family protein [Verrucomicrobiales bacterium]